MNVSWSLTDEQLEAAMDEFDWDDMADIRAEARKIADDAFNERVLE